MVRKEMAAQDGGSFFWAWAGPASVRVASPATSTAPQRRDSDIRTSCSWDDATEDATGLPHTAERSGRRLTKDGLLHDRTVLLHPAVEHGHLHAGDGQGPARLQHAGTGDHHL